MQRIALFFCFATVLLISSAPAHAADPAGPAGGTRRYERALLWLLITIGAAGTLALAALIALSFVR